MVSRVLWVLMLVVAAGCASKSNPYGTWDRDATTRDPNKAPAVELHSVPLPPKPNGSAQYYYIRR